MLRFTGKALLAAAAIALAACSSAPKQETLYDRLGGRPAIDAVVDDFVANVAAEPDLLKTFTDRKTDMVKFKQLLGDQICQIAGGPCVYKGRSMEEAHKGMNITPEQFNRTGLALAAALRKNGVKDPEFSEVMAAVAGTAPQIIGK